MKNIRFATIHDIPAICSIFTHYVENSVASFAYEAMDEKAWEHKLKTLQQRYPFLVCEIEHEIVAYAYASSFREKEAYQWDVELSIYVQPSVVRQQVGTSLLKVLLDLLKLQKYHIAYSCITIPNDASILLHKKLGFQNIGVFKKSGYKFERWLDIAWMEYTFSDAPMPDKILTISQCNPKLVNKIFAQAKEKDCEQSLSFQ